MTGRVELLIYWRVDVDTLFFVGFIGVEPFFFIIGFVGFLLMGFHIYIYITYPFEQWLLNLG